MAWTIELEAGAVRDLARLGKEPARRIRDYLASRVARLKDPRGLGEAMKGSSSGLWRYRVGDYRVICEILDAKLIVLVVKLGHRKDVYK